MDKYTDKQMDKLTDIWTDGHTDGQADRLTDGQNDRYFMMDFCHNNQILVAYLDFKRPNTNWLGQFI